MDLPPMLCPCDPICLAEPSPEFCYLARVYVRYLQVIDMPAYRHLRPINRLIRDAWIVWVKHEPIALEVPNELFVK